MKKAELKVAYVYDCDECGTENFVRSVVYEFDDETAGEMKVDYGIEDWEEGEWCSIPDEVQCKFCKTKYKTIDYRSEDD